MPLSWPEAEGLQCDTHRVSAVPCSVWSPLLQLAGSAWGSMGCQALKLTLGSCKSCRTSLELFQSLHAFLDLSAKGDSVLYSYIQMSVCVSSGGR